MASFNATLDTTKKHTFIVEHMDPELEKWQILEYSTIASECTAASSQFILSGLPKHVSDLSQVEQSPSSVDDLVSSAGIPKERVCLLDPRGESDLAPEDGDKFDVFVFGGILGDDPPRDRTAELRVKGFGGRRLGKEQLTTDTAARVTRIVVQEKSEFVMFFFLVLFFCSNTRRNLLTLCVKVPLAEVPYVDRPSIQVSAAESVEMPFKYVKGKDGKAIMPEVRPHQFHVYRGTTNFWEG
jgi:ribosome biogenesis SPOUT family RNA methylase Rps3